MSEQEIYLNNAATSYPKPQCVLAAHAAALSAPPQGQYRSSESLHAGGLDVLGTCKRQLAGLFGIADEDRERIVLTSGATEALNEVLVGLLMPMLAEGNHFITTVTEHNSVLRPIYNHESLLKAMRLAHCDQNGVVSPATIEALMDSKTRAVVINHCSNVTGAVQDIQEISRIAHANGAILIMDASQSAGCIPFSVGRKGSEDIDAFIFTGHKSLLGVQGTGGYWVRAGLIVKPLLFGGTGKDSRRLSYDEDNYEYEVGTRNMPGIAALSEAVSLLRKETVEAIYEREQGLMKLIYEGLAEISGVRVFGTPDTNAGPVMSFTVAGMTPADLSYILSNGYHITVRTGLHCAPLIHEDIGSGEAGTVRVSVGYQTTREEVKALLQAVGEIAASCQ